MDHAMLTVKFSDGNLYGIDIDLIAENRAAILAQSAGNQFTDEWWSEYDRVYKQTVENENELTEWARNNMTWEELEENAIMLFDESVTNTYKIEWTNAPMEVITVVTDGSDDMEIGI